MGSIRERQFKILVVDDSLQNIQLLGNMLKIAGYEVGFATDGEQALKILHNQVIYDLKLLDIDMPVMNGFETCRIIRKDELLKEIPVIFLTAFTDSDKIIEGFEIGAQDYVTKPFHPSELLARVNTHLQLTYKTELLREVNNTLELKVEQRTAALTEANIKIARLDKAKSDFLMLISHEMRTPLNGIIGLTELLKDSASNPVQSEYIEYLVLSAAKLLKFSDSALLITNLQLKDYDFSREKQNLKHLLESILLQFEDKINNKNIQIIRKFSSEEWLIPADRELLEVSLKCILENAITFSPEGSEIVISIGKKNEEIQISIIDQGPGFAEESIAQSFESFNAADMAHHSEGFGLSLAAVKLIMDIHSGSIQIHNNKTGAQVSLCMPLI